LRDVSDNPELTKADFGKAKPFAEAFPDLAASIRKGRGPNKAPTKRLVSLRLSPEVIEHFKGSMRPCARSSSGKHLEAFRSALIKARPQRISLTESESRVLMAIRRG
jgi:hypothetical protein